MIDLVAEFGKIYKVILEESAIEERLSREEKLWFYIIPCEHGQIYVQGEKKLAAYCPDPNYIYRLLKIKGLRVHQRGDSEITVIFAKNLFQRVADLLVAERRDLPKPRIRPRSEASIGEENPPESNRKRPKSARKTKRKSRSGDSKVLSGRKTRSKSRSKPIRDRFGRFAPKNDK